MVSNASAKIDSEKMILDLLTQLGGKQFDEDKMIERHGDRIVLPEHMSIRQVKQVLTDHDEAEKQTMVFTKIFNYRPWDGAYCTQQALLKCFGTAGRQINLIKSGMFGPESSPPETITITTGPGQTLQVPWGRIAFPLLEGEITFDSVMDYVKGLLFSISVECPRKHRGRVEGLFRLIEVELDTNSLYRGKAFNGAMEPDFLDPNKLDERKIVYSEEVTDQLEANVWSLVEQTKLTEELGLPLKRAVLLSGVYGTGKSLAAMLTAKKAIANGWTFIQCRPSTDSLESVMQTARLYEPCVVFYEDVDTIGGVDKGAEQISKVLDMFDGIAAKHTKLMMVLTTNQPEKLHKGMLRPGRLDSIIEINGLDDQAKEKLLRVLVPEGVTVSEDVDWTRVCKAMEGFFPAYIKEMADRAVRYTLARTHKRPEIFTTDDLVRAAEGLRSQYNLMNDAKDKPETKSLETALSTVVMGSLERMELKRDSEGRNILAEIQSPS